MSGRNIFALIMLIGCGVIYGYMNDWFHKGAIQITPSVRPNAASRMNPKVFPVSFLFDNKYRLTSVKVVSKDDAETNKFPRPLWNMFSDSSSAPVKMIVYGQGLQNMKPSIPRGRPEPLQPKTAYRLLIEAQGGLKGHVDFQTAEVPAAMQSGRN